MSCHRCMGLCVADYVEENGKYITIRRCVNCGSIMDPIIMRNKIDPPNGKRLKRAWKRTSKKSVYQKETLLHPVCA